MKNLAKTNKSQPLLSRNEMQTLKAGIIFANNTEILNFYQRNNVRNVASTDMHNINDIINSTNIFDARLKEYDIVLVNSFIFQFT